MTSTGAAAVMSLSAGPAATSPSTAVSDDDVLRGSQGRDLFTMEAGNDSIHGGRDHDTIQHPFGLRLVGAADDQPRGWGRNRTFGHDAIHQIENVDLEWNEAVSIIGTDGQNRIRVSAPANARPIMS